MKIQHLTHTQIDKQKWDEVVAHAASSLVYGMSWYLDAVAPNWEALVADDYRFVMPIPVKSKFGLRYIVQPEMVQQLMVFSAEEVTADIMRLFVKKLPAMSYELALAVQPAGMKSAVRPNYMLDLQTDYELIRKGYSKNTARNLKKASDFKLNIRENQDIEDFLDAYQATERNFQAYTVEIMRRLITAGIEHQAFQLFAVENEQKEAIAWACIAYFQGRLTYLIPFSSEEGMNKSAMFYLIDYLIERYAEKAKFLDFEGSAVEGIARFYKSFRAKHQPYYVIKRLRPTFLIGRLSR